jgi:arylsulfatase A-like enzyme
MFEPYKNADLKSPNFQQDDESLDKPAPLCNTLRNWQKKDEKYFINYRRHFYAMVTGVDMAVGEILEMLRNRGELDDTLIVFSSDHGDMCGDHNAVSKHVSFYDELMHLPLILFWPNGLGAEPRRVSGLVEMVDLLPTLLGLCNINIPRVMAGNDYSDALLNGEDIPGREDVLAYHAPDFFMLRSNDYKYIRYAEDKEVLYDLQQDSGETINQAGNAEYSDALNHMRYRAVGRLAAASQSCLPRYFEF